MVIGSDKAIRDTIRKLGGDILRSESFQSEKNYIQHGSITCWEHSLAVTYMSVWLARTFHIGMDMKSVVRGALLHDYFLYDWHDDAVWHRLHGYHHARTAMQKARRDFHITKKEQQIIYRHMFPLNITRIPNSREAAVVCLADKLVALLESVTKGSYQPVLTEDFQPLALRIAKRLEKEEESGRKDGIRNVYGKRRRDQQRASQAG